MKQIVPNLWFDGQAEEAAKFYTSVFENSKLGRIDHYTDAGKEIHGHKAGDVLTVEFEIEDLRFIALNGGPQFTINPSISFFVNFDPSQNPDAANAIDKVWEQLVEGGKVLMPLDEYPFSKHYGWVQDRFGVSWQLILTDPEGDERPVVIPSLLFTQAAYGKAEEALNYYVSVFKNTKMGQVAYYPAGMEPEKEGTTMFGEAKLDGQWITAMDSAQEHTFSFNEGISLMVECQTQAEIDEYWEKLSAVPEAEACGWLKDKYGVSWQITPTVLNDMLRDGTPEQIERVTEAFMKMKKFDIAELERIYNQS